MLRLNRFSYVAPRTLVEALDLLARHGQDAALMAGGTDVLVNIKHRLITPRVLISVRELPELRRQAVEDGWLTLGSGVTLQQVEDHPLVQERYPALAYAAHVISSPQVRAVGTIGGNVCLDTRCNYYNQSYEWRKGIGFCMKKDSPICRVAPGGDRCWAVASADTVPVLMALGAEVTVVTPSGTRRQMVEHLYRDDGLTPLTLQPGELISAIHLPPADGTIAVYQKFRIRHSFDFPLVGVAVSIRRGADGAVEDARIVLTAVASFPERAAAAEQALLGRPLTEDSIAVAGQAVYRLAKPMDNTAGTIFHRKRMARVLADRALREIAGLREPVRNTA